MKNLIACIAAGAAILIGAPADAAGVFRAYLSSKGNDANPCSVTAPGMARMVTDLDTMTVAVL